MTNYPHRLKKKPPREEEVYTINVVLNFTLLDELFQYCVAVIEDEDGKFLLKQRPSTGTSVPRS